jgi:uncharacterized protein (DUF1697 family)
MHWQSERASGWSAKTRQKRRATCGPIEIGISRARAEQHPFCKVFPRMLEATFMRTARASLRAPKSTAASRSDRIAFAAMLRGINMGGKNRLPMNDLVAMFADAGCVDVRSYIQSGNVTFRAPPAVAARAASNVKDEIETQFGFAVPIVLRTGDELLKVSVSNPFLKDGVRADRVHVMFLANLPEGACVAALDSRRSPPDAFVVSGRDIYLHCPDGVGKSRLTNQYFDSRLKTTGTARNWNTVLKLVEMTRG